MKASYRRQLTSLALVEGGEEEEEYEEEYEDEEQIIKDPRISYQQMNDKLELSSHRRVEDVIFGNAIVLKTVRPVHLWVVDLGDSVVQLWHLRS